MEKTSSGALTDFQDAVIVDRIVTAASADFNKRYDRLVDDLRALRDLHNMDPQRIALQAIRTLELRTKHAKSEDPLLQGFVEALDREAKTTVQAATFNQMYRKLVEDLRVLRDDFDMDPERVSQQAIATLQREHP